MSIQTECRIGAAQTRVSISNNNKQMAAQSFDAAFEKFAKQVNGKVATPLSDQFIEMLRTQANDVFKPMCAAAAGAAAAPVKPKRYASGYNLFMKEFYQKNPDMADRQTECPKAWTALGDVGKAPYNEQAKAAKEAAQAAEAEVAEGSPDAAKPEAAAKPKKAKAKAAADPNAEKKTRGKNGWEMFYTETKAADPELSRDQIGAKWKVLPDAQQKVFKDKATAFNEKAKAVKAEPAAA